MYTLYNNEKQEGDAIIIFKHSLIKKGIYSTSTYTLTLVAYCLPNYSELIYAWHDLDAFATSLFFLQSFASRLVCLGACYVSGYLWWKNTELPIKQSEKIGFILEQAWRFVSAGFDFCKC